MPSIEQTFQTEWLEARRALRGQQLNLRRYMREELEVVAHQILDVAVVSAPMETGRLRSSMSIEGTYEATDAAVRFIADVPYALYMEEGFTKRDGEWWEGKHFLRGALEGMEYLFDDAMMRAITRAVISFG